MAKKWTKDATTKSKEISDGQKKRLRELAEILAEHDGIEQVSRRHVEESDRVLRQQGVADGRWQDNPANWLAAGAFFFGFMCSMPDLTAATLGSFGAPAYLEDSCCLAGIMFCMAFASVLWWVGYSQSTFTRKRKRDSILLLMAAVIFFGLLSFVCWKQNADKVAPPVNQPAVIQQPM